MTEGLQAIPEMFDAEEAAERLRARGVKITGPTIDNLRRAGEIGFIPIDKRFYFTEAILIDYLNSVIVAPSYPAASRSGSDRAGTIGSPSIPSGPTETGAEPGTIPEHVKHAVSALAEQTFRRRKR